MKNTALTSPHAMLSVRPKDGGLYLLGQGDDDRAGYEIVKSETKSDPKDMTVSCTISMQSEDSRGDVIVTNGIDLTDHEKNPVVLYNHGYSLDKPIGMAVGADGKYSVKKGIDRVTAVTKFSESLLEAEQIFSLINEGILRGVSVGINLKKAEWREDAMDKNSWPTLMIHQSRLFEYSHTPCPIHQDALCDYVHKGVICGKPIPDGLKQSFSPWVKEKAPVVTSGFDPAQFKANMEASFKAILEQAILTRAAELGKPKEDGKVKVEDEKPKITIKADSTPAPEEENMNEPTGSRMLRGLHDRILEMAEFVEFMSAQEMQSEIEILADDVRGDFEKHLSRLVLTFRSKYPHLGALGVEPDATEGDQKTQREKVKARLAEVKKGVESALASKRRLKQTAKEQCQTAADFLKKASEVLPAESKDQAMQLAATLAGIGAAPADEVTPEAYSKLKGEYDALLAKSQEAASMHERLLKEFNKLNRGR